MKKIAPGGKHDGRGAGKEFVRGFAEGPREKSRGVEVIVANGEGVDQREVAVTTQRVIRFTGETCTDCVEKLPANGKTFFEKM